MYVVSIVNEYNNLVDVNAIINILRVKSRILCLRHSKYRIEGYFRLVYIFAVKLKR